MQQITLLYASEDRGLAEQLERQIRHANDRMVVVHNNNAMYGENIETAWTKTLYSSHLFVVLISADLTNTDSIMRYVHDAIKAESSRMIMVQVRPCWLEDGRFEGYEVIPNKPVTNYSGAAKEEIWLQIVRFILDALSDVTEPIGYHEPRIQSWQQPIVPVRKFAHRREAPRPTIVEKPVISNIEEPHQTQPKIWQLGVVVLSAPQDKAWLPYIDRTFRIMQRSIPIEFTIYHNPEQARDVILDVGLTLALISPDFLANEYIDLYHVLVPTLSEKKPIIPIMIRYCEWSDTISIPRRSAIKKVSNDAAWVEVLNEIRAILKDRYPHAIPGTSQTY